MFYQPKFHAVFDGVVCMIPNKGAFRRLEVGGKLHYVDGIAEKRCPKCEEFWPIDSEFFPYSKTSAVGLHSYCKACVTDVKNKSEDHQTWGYL